MKTINTSEIPSFLLNSKKARTVSVPKEYFCNDLQLTYPTDLIKFLRIVNYWDVDELPDEVYQYLNKVIDDEIQKRELSELLNEVKHLKFIKEIHFFKDFDKKKFEVCLAEQLELLNYIKSEGYSKIYEFFNNHFNIANQVSMSKHVQEGDLESIKLLFDYGCKLTEEDFKTIVSKGFDDCMSYYVENKEFRNRVIDTYERGVLFADIFEHGYFDCLKYLCESSNNYEYKKNSEFVNKVISLTNIYKLAEKNHLECLKYFTKKFWTGAWQQCIGQQILMRACKFGHLEIVKLCIANNCLYSNNTKKTNYDNCATPLFVAVKNNHLEIVKLLWNAYSNNLHVTSQKTTQYYLNYALEHGNLEMIKFLRNKGFIMCATPYEKAAKGNNIEIVKYLADSNVRKERSLYSTTKLSDKPVQIAAKNGNFEMVKYLMELGFSYHYDYVIRSVISINRVDLLEFFIKKHEILNPEKYCECAVYNNAFECLKYLHENDYKWSRECVDQAVKLGKFEMLKYLLDNGCPVALESGSEELKSNYINSYKLLIEHLEKN